MRIVFMGTPTFACPSLRGLHEAGHLVALVVTRPDKPRGRSSKPMPPPVKEFAQGLGLPVLQPEEVNAPEVLDRLRAINPDLIVTAAFGQKLGKELLDIPRLGCINVHASLLPKYRGAAPVNWAILRGETETGVTIFRMREEIDAGEIIAQMATPILPEETAGELTERLASLGARLLVKTVEDLAAGKAQFRPQDPAGATRAPVLRKEDGLVNWTRPATELYNFVRGMTPWPGAYTYHLEAGAKPMRLTLLAVRAEADVSASPSAAPGAILRVEKDDIVAATGQGVLHILRLKPAGGREMTTAEYLRGHPARPGGRFTST